MMKQFVLDVKMLNRLVKISMNITNEGQKPSNTMMQEKMKSLRIEELKR